MRKIVFGIVLLLVAIVGVSNAFGQRGGREFRLGWISERLNLDEATAAAVDAVVEETETAAKDLRRSAKDERRALGELLKADLPDADAVMAQVERLGQAETALNKHRIATMLRIRSLLTPEQRAELASMGPRGRHPKAFEACAADLEALCAGVEPGRPTIRCLRENREALSETCRDALPGKGRRGFHGHPMRDGDGGPPEP